jgi:hypothetical protein
MVMHIFVQLHKILTLENMFTFPFCLFGSSPPNPLRLTHYLFWKHSHRHTKIIPSQISWYSFSLACGDYSVYNWKLSNFLYRISFCTFLTCYFVCLFSYFDQNFCIGDFSFWIFDIWDLVILDCDFKDFRLRGYGTIEDYVCHHHFFTFSDLLNCLFL